MENIVVNGNKTNNLADAQKAAWTVAREKLGSQAVLWAWYEHKTGKHSPPVECCGADCGKPAWVVYAETRGGNLKVSVDKSGYDFYFGVV